MTAANLFRQVVEKLARGPRRTQVFLLLGRGRPQADLVASRLNHERLLGKDGGIITGPDGTEQ